MSTPYEPPGQNPQPPYTQPPVYGQSTYGAQMLPIHPQGSTILILGILGIFLPVLSIIAWVLGNTARRDILAGNHYSNESNITTGRMLGKVFTIIDIVAIVLGVLVWVIFAVLLVGASTYGSG